jgi:hypothetical protein
MRAQRVQSLLMGGQACVAYGAAEFSRDTDLAILAAPDNLRRLAAAVADLQGVVTAVPPFEARYLERGHAVHFRAERADVRGMRIDVMARMRGVDAFPDLWARRTTLRLADETADTLDVEIMALPDLVAAKKTQRDKDWPMLRRLVEANYFQYRDDSTAERVDFWLRELRTPELLAECVRAFPDAARALSGHRAAIALAILGESSVIERELDAEQARERTLDRAYWAPLRAELEQLRRQQRAEPRA